MTQRTDDYSNILLGIFAVLSFLLVALLIYPGVPVQQLADEPGYRVARK